MEDHISDQPAFHWLFFYLGSWLLGLPGGRQSHFQPAPADGAREEAGKCPLDVEVRLDLSGVWHLPDIPEKLPMTPPSHLNNLIFV